MIRTVSAISEVSALAWNSLAGNNPAQSHAYFLALEKSGCASARTGWMAQFLLAYEDAELVGAMPLYFKTHSYGEFVFDWAWAEAYERHGLAYYPKLVSSIPFTPISGTRAMGKTKEIRAALVQAALKLAHEARASSFHCLFPLESEARELGNLGLMLRQQLQFHWQNQGYKNFESFLASLRHQKRKKIHQERRRLVEKGISFERVEGVHATNADWEFFYRCYVHTHQLYRSPIPLTLDFFLQLAATMPENLLLVFASREGARIAAAFDLMGAGALYGRSWGALEYHPGLHFELCYYQAIEFCIERRIPLFEGGAQGEHKLARGFLPVTTWSAHWLAHPEFSKAVEEFLAAESESMDQARLELGESSPFKK